MKAIEWRIHTYAQLSSTQDYVKELADEGLPEGVVIQCLTQTKGRGRHGNAWASPMGGLYMSVLLRPECSALQAGQLSFVTAVAVSAAIDDVLDPGHKKTLKWPNDILIDGRKCAGILLESGGMARTATVDWIAVGVGVNILSAPEGALCLQEVCRGRQIPIHPFRDIVLGHLSAYYTRWREKGFSEIRTSWLSQAHRLEQQIRARTGGDELCGIFAGIDENGALVMEMEDGTERFVSAAEIIC